MVTSDNVAGIDAGQELGIADLVAAPALAGVLEQIEQRHQQQADHDPDGEVPKVRIHRDSFMPWPGTLEPPPVPGRPALGARCIADSASPSCCLT